MKILLLEDDLILSTELTKFLEESGFEVTKVFEGDSVEIAMKQNSFDIFLLDINVPKLDGLKVCEKIRSSEKNIPIIMISAFGDLSSKKEAFGFLANDYLVKPFQFEELLMRINSLLRRKDTNDQSLDDIIKIEDLLINKTEQKVFRNGQEIMLTVKEQRLLIFLAEAQGRTVSKQQITEYVWEHNFNTNTNTVEVYINFLRKKIDKDFELKLIHTRSGFGYYLSAL
ncbi:response regulator transcription factor [Halpernia sp. GG3]